MFFGYYQLFRKSKHTASTNTGSRGPEYPQTYSFLYRLGGDTGMDLVDIGQVGEGIYRPGGDRGMADIRQVPRLTSYGSGSENLTRLI